MFDDEGVNIVHCLMVQNYEYEKCLKGFGFVDSMRTHNIYLHLTLGMSHYYKIINNTPAERVHFSHGNLV